MSDDAGEETPTDQPEGTPETEKPEGGEEDKKPDKEPEKEPDKDSAKDPGKGKDREPGECPSPSPSGEDIPPAESNQIMQLTQEILQLSQKKVDDQKIGSHSLSFMLLRIKESLDTYYNDYIPMLNTFLYYAEKITADYYAHIICVLPQYGDFVKAIENEEGDQLEVGFPSLVPKRQLVTLVQNVTDNYYAAAMFVKAGRANYKDIVSYNNERKDMVCKVVKNIPDWLKLQDNVTRGLEDIRDQTFKISAYVDFLKQGESKISPTLDLSKLAELDNDGRPASLSTTTVHRTTTRTRTT